MLLSHVSCLCCILSLHNPAYIVEILFSYKAFRPAQVNLPVSMDNGFHSLTEQKNAGTCVPICFERCKSQPWFTGYVFLKYTRLNYLKLYYTSGPRCKLLSLWFFSTFNLVISMNGELIEWLWKCMAVPKDMNRVTARCKHDRRPGLSLEIQYYCPRNTDVYGKHSNRFKCRAQRVEYWNPQFADSITVLG